MSNCAVEHDLFWYLESQEKECDCEIECDCEERWEDSEWDRAEAQAESEYYEAEEEYYEMFG